MSFTWNVLEVHEHCEHVHGIEEGVELAVKQNGGAWIPLQIVYNDEDANEGCDEDTIIVRGYEVPVVDCSANPQHRYHTSLCGDFIAEADNLQFRWMGSAQPLHYWNLDNVCVNLQRDSSAAITLISDSFTATDEPSCTNFNRSQCDLKYVIITV